MNVKFNLSLTVLISFTIISGVYCTTNTNLLRPVMLDSYPSVRNLFKTFSKNHTSS